MQVLTNAVYMSSEAFAGLIAGQTVSMLSGKEGNVRDEDKDFFLVDAQAAESLDDALVVKGAGFAAMRTPIYGWFVKQH